MQPSPGTVCYGAYFQLLKSWGETMPKISDDLTLSADARYVLAALVQCVLLVRNVAPDSWIVAEAMLVACKGRTHKLDGFNVSVLIATELVQCGRLVPLSQFRHRNRSGWRETVGELGEKWDVYVPVQ